jgi:hypothetical protein
MWITDEWTAVSTKLKAEWKTFALAVGATIAGAVEAGAELGLQVPDLLSWCPDKVKPYLLFVFGLAMLWFRRYRPTLVEQAPTVVEAPVEPAQTETPPVASE